MLTHGGSVGSYKAGEPFDRGARIITHAPDWRPSLRISESSKDSRIYADRHVVAGVGDRRQHRDLQRPEFSFGYAWAN